MTKHKAQLYIVEARDEQGNLLLDVEQPPFHVASERQLFQYVYDNYPEAEGLTWEGVREVFRRHHWTIRERHW